MCYALCLSVMYTTLKQPYIQLEFEHSTLLVFGQSTFIPFSTRRNIIPRSRRRKEQLHRFSALDMKRFVEIKPLTLVPNYSMDSKKYPNQKMKPSYLLRVDRIQLDVCRSTSAKPADRRSPQRTSQAHQTKTRTVKIPNLLLN